ncbi:MAG: hypothetical protein LBI34_02775 [Puniceicoccales bacterium]|nr:hypothetical protein [Puniceicoccales bacterium]
MRRSLDNPDRKNANVHGLTLREKGILAIGVKSSNLPIKMDMDTGEFV